MTTLILHSRGRNPRPGLSLLTFAGARARRRHRFGVHLSRIPERQPARRLTGLYDFRCTLWDAAGGGSQSGSTLTLDDRQVTTGVFTLDLDFGSAAYAGDARWLQGRGAPGRLDRRVHDADAAEAQSDAVHALDSSLPHSQIVQQREPVDPAPQHRRRPRRLVPGGRRRHQLRCGRLQLEHRLTGRRRLTASRPEPAGSRSASWVSRRHHLQAPVWSAPGRRPAPTSRAPDRARPASTRTASHARFTPRTPRPVPRSRRAGSRDRHGERRHHRRQRRAGYVVLRHQQRAGRAPRATVASQQHRTPDGMCEWALNGSTQATAHFQERRQRPGCCGCRKTARATSSGLRKAARPSSGSTRRGVTHTKVLEILGGADPSERFEVGEADCGDRARNGGEHRPRARGPAPKWRQRRVRPPRCRRDQRRGWGCGLACSWGRTARSRARPSPVALSGRVYCRATVANGPIAPGDLLTTSSVPGYCMRVGDPARAQSAIIGRGDGVARSGRGTDPSSSWGSSDPPLGRRFPIRGAEAALAWLASPGARLRHSRCSLPRAQAQYIYQRVAYRYILDGNGQRLARPIPRSGEAAARDRRATNRMLDRFGRGYRFQFEPSSDVAGATQFYDLTHVRVRQPAAIDRSGESGPVCHWRTDAFQRLHRELGAVGRCGGDPQLHASHRRRDGIGLLQRHRSG